MRPILTSLRAILVFTFLLGGIYPLLTWIFAIVFFPQESAGNLVRKNGVVVGSSLLAQEFKRPRYFWPRPSAVGYAPVPSGGSNLGPTSKALLDRVRAARAAGLEGEMLYASGSGLDPHVSVAAARAQVARVAAARGLEEAAVYALVEKTREGRQFGFLGEERVNVLRLNLALDGEAR